MDRRSFLLTATSALASAGTSRMAYAGPAADTPRFSTANRLWQAAYDKALTINPNHKGALEYKGELYLTLGNLSGAEELLERLRKSCSFNCSEVKDLKDAIAAYKKAQ